MLLSCSRLIGVGLFALALCPEAQQMHVGVTAGNQPAKGDSTLAQDRYSELNERLAAHCPEPAKACVLQYAAYQHCLASGGAECGSAPTCTATCDLSPDAFKALGALWCSARSQPFVSLAPDWFAVFQKQLADGSFRTSPQMFQSGPSPVLRVASCSAAGYYETARMSFLSQTDPDLADGKAPFVRAELVGEPVKKVAAAYPPLARAARMQGQVVLRVHVAKDGSVESVDVVSGPPLLGAAAVDAVRQWMFRPGPLTGKPYPFETAVTVNFNLNGGVAPGQAGAGQP